MEKKKHSFQMVKSVNPVVPWSPKLAKLQSMPKMKRPKVGTPKNEPTTDGQVRVKHTSDGPEMKIKKEGVWKPLEQEENVDTAMKGLMPLYIGSLRDRKRAEERDTEDLQDDLGQEGLEKAGPQLPANPANDLDTAKEGEIRTWKTKHGTVERIKQGGRWVSLADKKKPGKFWEGAQKVAQAGQAGLRAGQQAGRMIQDPTGSQVVGAIAGAPADALSFAAQKAAQKRQAAIERFHQANQEVDRQIARDEANRKFALFAGSTETGSTETQEPKVQAFQEKADLGSSDSAGGASSELRPQDYQEVVDDLDIDVDLSDFGIDVDLSDLEKESERNIQLQDPQSLQSLYQRDHGGSGMSKGNVFSPRAALAIRKSVRDVQPQTSRYDVVTGPKQYLSGGGLMDERGEPRAQRNFVEPSMDGGITDSRILKSRRYHDQSVGASLDDGSLRQHAARQNDKLQKSIMMLDGFGGDDTNYYKFQGSPYLAQAMEVCAKKKRCLADLKSLGYPKLGKPDSNKEKREKLFDQCDKICAEFMELEAKLLEFRASETRKEDPLQKSFAGESFGKGWGNRLSETLEPFVGTPFYADAFRCMAKIEEAQVALDRHDEKNVDVGSSPRPWNSFGLNFDRDKKASKDQTVSGKWEQLWKDKTKAEAEFGELKAKFMRWAADNLDKKEKESTAKSFSLLSKGSGETCKGESVDFLAERKGKAPNDAQARSRRGERVDLDNEKEDLDKGKLTINGKEQDKDLTIRHEAEEKASKSLHKSTRRSLSRVREMMKGIQDTSSHYPDASIVQRDRHYWGEDGDTRKDTGHPFERKKSK